MQNNYFLIFNLIWDRIKIVSIQVSFIPEAFRHVGQKQNENDWKVKYANVFNFI